MCEIKRLFVTQTSIKIRVRSDALKLSSCLLRSFFHFYERSHLRSEPISHHKKCTSTPPMRNNRLKRVRKVENCLFNHARKFAGPTNDSRPIIDVYARAPNYNASLTLHCILSARTRVSMQMSGNIIFNDHIADRTESMAMNLGSGALFLHRPHSIVSAHSISRSLRDPFIDHRGDCVDIRRGDLAMAPFCRGRKAIIFSRR